ncbi:MAG TPA: T9SS type A sorting domain-containing protein [Saprospiraceae bacterium]|nr:T9SS type A sorting domain-containing protein [Saprospiraceae bacterium]HPI05969.1 T9SS type A sorting domain-containing protein [Saprospiraceae bacterium]
MNRILPLVRFINLLFFLTAGFCLPASAADGFDNNYVGGDANQLYVTINGLNRAVLFGPGAMSTGSFFIGIPNGVTDDRGQVSSFVLTGAASFLRSAYFDRVNSTALYYRIYPAMTTPPGWSTLTLQPQSPLVPGTCYTATQSNTWQITQSVNVLQGLSNGHYVLEFYIQSELYDVGLEEGSCTVNALEQCNTAYVHNGRYISSRFNTTDPMACDLANVIATQSAPTQILFEVINAPLPVELTYFRGAEDHEKVQLRWATAQEEDVDDFLLEHSADGQQWSALAEIAAIGNSTHLQEYGLLDEQPFSGKNYYRLLARSFDGQVDVAPVIEIDVAGQQTGLSVWPNPVRYMLHYSVLESKNTSFEFRVFDATGRLLAQQSSDDAGTFTVSDFPEGLYFLEMYDAGERVEVARFLKVD